jgi:hypothetical protein
MNQFATPGLGSLMGRRFIAGTGQLLLAFPGFLLVCGWFLNLMWRYYRMMFHEIDPHIHYAPLLWGAGLFGLAWLWSWVTSISLLCEARRNEREGRLIPTDPVPPRL